MEPRLANDEQIILHSQGGYKGNLRSGWKLGHFYLTNQRLVFATATSIKFETALGNIKGSKLEKQRYVAGGMKDVIAIQCRSSVNQRLSKAWLIMPNLNMWRQKIAELACLALLEKVWEV